MIAVQLLHTNWFQIKGDRIEGGSVTIHADGWEIAIRVEGMYEHRENVPRSQVLPAMREMLDNMRCDEQLNTAELNTFLNEAARFHDRAQRNRREDPT